MCRSMRPLRLGEEKRRQIEEETTGKNMMACTITQGGHNNKLETVSIVEPLQNRQHAQKH